MRRLLVVGSMAILCLADPGAVDAATTDEAVALLESAAGGDLVARDRARRIESIDGVPVDVGRLLEATDAEPSVAADIVRTRFILDPGPEISDSVDSVLSQERFAQSTNGPLDRWLDRIGSWITERMSRLSGGGSTRRANILAVLVVLALVGGVTAIATRRRAAVVRKRISLDRLIAEEGGVDPAGIERDARAAADAGDYTRSVRLRFVAGILRLDQQGLIHYTRGLTTREIAQAIRSPVFDELNDDFDRVVYGDEQADLLMERRSEAGWPQLLEQAVRR